MKNHGSNLIQLALSIYDGYTELFKQGVLNYDEMSKVEKVIYGICSNITLKVRGIIERPDFLFID